MFFRYIIIHKIYVSPLSGKKYRIFLNWFQGKMSKFWFFMTFFRRVSNRCVDFNVSHFNTIIKIHVIWHIKKTKRSTMVNPLSWLYSKLLSICTTGVHIHKLFGWRTSTYIEILPMLNSDESQSQETSYKKWNLLICLYGLWQFTIRM